MQQGLKPLACEIQGKASCSPVQELKLHFAAVNEHVLKAGGKKRCFGNQEILKKGAELQPNHPCGLGAADEASSTAQ